MGSAIKKANQVFNASASGNGITADELESAADELESAADELQKTVESVASASLSEPHPLVIKANKLNTLLRGRATATKVSAVHVV